MRKLMLLVVGAAMGVLLAACAQPIKMAWVRTDGAPMRTNPVLAQQFEIDRTICDGETSKAHMSGAQFCRGATDCLLQSMDRQQSATTVAHGCMAQRGYINVPEDQAEAKAAELRALQAPPPVMASPAPRQTTGARR